MQKFPTEETCADIVAQAHAYLATKTEPLGNGALATILGDPTWLAACRRFDAVALAGDLEATKKAGRRYIREVLGLLASSQEEI